MRREREHRDGAGWYRIANSAGDGAPAQILIYDEIGMWGVTASDFIRDLAAAGNGPVEVHINSGGGDVFEAYAIYNALLARAGVTTVVDSLAASAASVIAMAGETRLMARTSQLMIHDASAWTGGNAEDMQQMVERLQTVSDQIAGIYADTAGGNADHWRGLMRAETWFTPEQALEAGLITGILSTTRETAPAAAVSPGTGIRAAATTVPEGSQTAGAPAPQGEEPTMPQEQGALTIEARRSRITDIAGRLQEIAAQYPAALLPADMQAEWDQLVAERREHQAALAAVDARNEVLADIHAGRPQTHEGPQAAAVRGGAQPQAPQRPGAPAVHLSRDIYDLAGIRQQARSAEELPALYRDNAMRAIEAARFPGSDREDAQTNVERLLNTVPDDAHGVLARRILATGSPAYKRVFGQALASGNPGSLGGHDGQILALGNTGSGGEYAVPFELDPTVILTSNGSVNPLRQIARVQPIVGKEYDLVTTAGVTVSRVAANTPATDNSPTLAQPTIKAERVQGFIPFNIEIEGDWTGMQASMMELLRDAKDIEEATAFTLGTGVSPDAGGVVTTLNVSSKVDGASGAVLSITDPTNLENALPPRFRGNASYMGAKSIYNAYRQLLLAQAGAAGDPWNRPSQGTPAEFFGYPAYEASDMASTVAAGNKVLLMGDFKRGFIIVDKVGMNMELVPHLTQQATAGSGVGMPTGQRGYYAWWRNNSRIIFDNAFRLLVVHA
ncbi:head maturation protease, ClpP-related [Streptomyces sp. NPDC048663]|uniref:head maturation protease, ClpP-related n=1 Tax=Streptomyces sp. NPDC048663 TaxID=3155638 RepID=UPI0034427607